MRTQNNVPAVARAMILIVAVVSLTVASVIGIADIRRRTIVQSVPAAVAERNLIHDTQTANVIEKVIRNTEHRGVGIAFVSFAVGLVIVTALGWVSLRPTTSKENEQL